MVTRVTSLPSRFGILTLKEERKRVTSQRKEAAAKRLESVQIVEDEAVVYKMTVEQLKDQLRKRAVTIGANSEPEQLLARVKKALGEHESSKESARGDNHEQTSAVGKQFEQIEISKT